MDRDLPSRLPFWWKNAGDGLRGLEYDVCIIQYEGEI